MFIINKYSKYYYNIIDQAKSRTLAGTVYTEKHHIIPKSFGGNNSKDNLVILTAREHFICHKLLVRMTTGIYRHKMAHALWRMCNSLKSDYKVTAHTYASARAHHAHIVSTVGTGGQFKIGRTTWNKGIPRTDEVKAAISKAHTGRKTGRTSETFTDEWKANISKANTGKETWNKGVARTGEERAKISATRKQRAADPTWNIRPPCSDEKANKIKLANMGKRWVHKKATKERKYVNPSVVADYLNIGWELGLGPKS